MAIDDPIEALQRQFEMEDLATSPVTKIVLNIVAVLSFCWPFDKIAEKLKEFLARDALQRIRLMLETCANQIHKHEKELEGIRKTMGEQQKRDREAVAKELLLDAARKSENTRSEERVKRIGLILANSMVEPKPIDADEIEEMMRVAAELGDRDVKLLRELVRIEGETVKTRGRIERFDAYTRWEQGSWDGRIDPELDSVFSKLESYGLVSRLAPPNNLNIMADFQNRYALLAKGLRFVNLTKH